MAKPPVICDNNKKSVAVMVMTVIGMAVYFVYYANFYRAPAEKISDLSNIIGQSLSATEGLNQLHGVPESVDSNRSKYFKLLKKLKIKCPQSQLNKTIIENIQQIPASECSFPYVEVDNRGRLGNQICQYMNLWIFRRLFGVRVVLSQKAYGILHSMFPGLTIPHTIDNCFPENTTVQVKKSSYENLYRLFYDSLDYLTANKMKEASLIPSRSFIANYPCTLDHISYYRDELQAEFQISSSLLIKAQNILDLKLTESKYSRRKVTLVSVHVRRTDYIRFTKKHGQILPDKDYFRNMMNSFRISFNNTVFAVFSDDLAWCRKNLNGPDVIFPGSGNIKEPHLDFALITLCDHHIIGLGTYSFTSSFLGNGLIAFGASTKYAEKTKFRSYMCNPLFTPVFI